MDVEVTCSPRSNDVRDEHDPIILLPSDPWSWNESISKVGPLRHYYSTHCSRKDQLNNYDWVYHGGSITFIRVGADCRSATTTTRFDRIDMTWCCNVRLTMHCATRGSCRFRSIVPGKTTGYEGCTKCVSAETSNHSSRCFRCFDWRKSSFDTGRHPCLLPACLLLQKELTAEAHKIPQSIPRTQHFSKNIN